ncbi:MAG: 3-oxoacyl-[acyl-carrier-protein] reductase [Nitrospirae bacterium]|nr:3-oxoacyl-[acyl-carrier-protein] reductase [Nitrospirota bacterium]
MLLNGKVAFVTGASRGIGKAIALTLAGAGADVAGVDVNIDELKTSMDELAKATGKRAFSLHADVGDYGSVETAVNDAVKALGRVDILVNNAGITKDNLLMRMNNDEWDRVIRINLTGTFNCTKAVIRGMVKNRSGRIISIASIVAEMGNPGQANYAASKAGIIGFTKTIAREYANRGITANAIAPGFIETDMTRALSEDVRKGLIAQIPMSRLGTPEDVANAVKFLASDDASYITGQVIHINGGMYM